jgi:hypothetical protein
VEKSACGQPNFIPAKMQIELLAFRHQPAVASWGNRLNSLGSEIERLGSNENAIDTL